METNFEKIQKLLADSSVSEAAKALFLESCNGVIDDNLELLVDLFVKDPEWIGKIIENFKEKYQSANERDMERWKRIVDKEVDMLDDVDRLEQLRTNSALGV